MNLHMLLIVAACVQTMAAAPVRTQVSDPPVVCDSCDGWNQPQPPFKIHGRSYYVGVRGLSSVLIQTSEGLILLDGGLPQSAALIEANIESLGFRIEDVKLILNSHAHSDHAGGIARLQRRSGAAVAASSSGAQALMGGGPVKDDPQFGQGGKDGIFPRVPKVRVVKDKEALRVGDTAITAHLTPGHTPGSTTWTWSSCVADDCVNIVYADSLSSVSSEGFRFLGDRTHPDVSETFRRSIATVGALPCDIIVSVHPDFTGLFDKLKRRSTSPARDPFIDSAGCRTYVSSASQSLDRRLEAERAATAK